MFSPAVRYAVPHTSAAGIVRLLSRFLPNIIKHMSMKTGYRQNISSNPEESHD